MPFTYKDFIEINAFVLNKVAIDRRKKALPKYYAKSLWDQLVMSAKILLAPTIAGIRFGNEPSVEKLTAKRWVIIGTSNQRFATQFLLDDDKYEAIIAPHAVRTEYGTKIKWTRITPLVYLPQYVYFLLKAYRNGYKEQVRSNFYQTIRGAGMYQNARSVLQKYQPEAVIMSNDHTSNWRAVAVAANSLNIPTVYLQHACVADDFPRLIHKLSLLEGQDSVDKYEPEESVTEVKLIGMPKFDIYATLTRQEGEITNIGVVYNLINHPAEVVRLVKILVEKFPNMKITVRPHPGDDREIDVSGLKNVHISDGRKEKSFAFLAEQDIIIGGYSSIHLEASLLNVHPVIYEFSTLAGKVPDLYGFVRNGLAHYVDSPVGLVQTIEKIIEEKPARSDTAKYYCDTIDTEWYGRSSELAKIRIDEFLAGSDV